MTHHKEGQCVPSLEKLFIHVARTHRRVASRLFEKHGIHRGQPPLLFALGHQDGRTNAELAEILDVSPATITNMVKRMEKGGFVTRQRDPHDDRSIRVFLTEHGQACSRELQATVDEMNAIAFNNFTAGEAATLQNLLKKMLSNLEGAAS